MWGMIALSVKWLAVDWTGPQFHERQEFFSCHFVQDCLWYPHSITNFSWTIYCRPLPSHHLYVSMAWCSVLQAILPVTLYMLHSHRHHSNLKQQISRSAVCSPGLKLISECCCPGVRMNTVRYCCVIFQQFVICVP